MRFLLRDLERIKAAAIPKPQKAKRLRIAKLLERDPMLTDVAVARKLKADAHIIADVRRELAKEGRIPPLRTVTGKDGKVHRIYDRRPSQGR